MADLGQPPTWKRVTTSEGSKTVTIAKESVTPSSTGDSTSQSVEDIPHSERDSSYEESATQEVVSPWQKWAGSSPQRKGDDIEYAQPVRDVTEERGTGVIDYSTADNLPLQSTSQPSTLRQMEAIRWAKQADQQLYFSKMSHQQLSDYYNYLREHRDDSPSYGYQRETVRRWMVRRAEERVATKARAKGESIYEWTDEKTGKVYTGTPATPVSAGLQTRRILEEEFRQTYGYEGSQEQIDRFLRESHIEVDYLSGGTKRLTWSKETRDGQDFIVFYREAKNFPVSTEPSALSDRRIIKKGDDMLYYQEGREWMLGFGQSSVVKGDTSFMKPKGKDEWWETPSPVVYVENARYDLSPLLPVRDMYVIKDIEFTGGVVPITPQKHYDIYKGDIIPDAVLISDFGGSKKFKGASREDIVYVPPTPTGTWKDFGIKEEVQTHFLQEKVKEEWLKASKFTQLTSIAGFVVGTGAGKESIRARFSGGDPSEAYVRELVRTYKETGTLGDELGENLSMGLVKDVTTKSIAGDYLRYQTYAMGAGIALPFVLPAGTRVGIKAVDWAKKIPVLGSGVRYASTKAGRVATHLAHYPTKVKVGMYGLVGGFEAVKGGYTYYTWEGTKAEKFGAVKYGLFESGVKIAGFMGGFKTTYNPTQTAIRRVRAWDVATEASGFKEGVSKVPWEAKAKMFLGGAWEDVAISESGGGITVASYYSRAQNMLSPQLRLGLEGAPMKQTMIKTLKGEVPSDALPFEYTATETLVGKYSKESYEYGSKGYQYTTRMGRDKTISVSSQTFKSRPYIKEFIYDTKGQLLPQTRGGSSTYWYENMYKPPSLSESISLPKTLGEATAKTYPSYAPLVLRGLAPSRLGLVASPFISPPKQEVIDMPTIGVPDIAQSKTSIITRGAEIGQPAVTPVSVRLSTSSRPVTVTDVSIKPISIPTDFSKDMPIEYSIPDSSGSSLPDKPFVPYDPLPPEDITYTPVEVPPPPYFPVGGLWFPIGSRGGGGWDKRRRSRQWQKRNPIVPYHLAPTIQLSINPYPSKYKKKKRQRRRRK